MSNIFDDDCDQPDFDEYEPDFDRDEVDGEVDYDEEYIRGDGIYMDDDRSMFADPGGKSALRAATRDNPRNLPCPTCGKENRLTPADVARSYQCDSCADRDEGGGY